jgi:hypothetical protein
MEILAGLIELEERNLLPLPWYNRPALGLISGTRVNVAAVTSEPRSEDYPPDIIVTPLSIGNLRRTTSLVIDLPEGLGSINRALRKVGNKFNIALMETVTIDQRSKHRITLVLEPPSAAAAPKYQQNLDRLVADLVALGADPKPNPYWLANPGVTFTTAQPSKVHDGHVDIEDVREWIDEKYSHLAGDFDFDKVVVSSNTEARFIRYIFPRKGAFELHVPHEDIPTAMQHLTSSLTRLNYNILLSRISKSESSDLRKHQPSVTVAICEPVGGKPGQKPDTGLDAGQIRKKIQASLPAARDAIKYMFRVPPNLISFGRKASDIQSKRASRLARRTVQVPPPIANYLKNYNKEQRRVVFVSYPDVAATQPESRTAELLGRILDMIQQSGLASYDGYARPTAPINGRLDDVWARMWRADAALFIAPTEEDAPGDEQKHLWLTANQQIEWSFMAALCQNSEIICHRRARAEREFMMPDTVRIEYEQLPDEFSRIEAKIRQKLEGWFPSTDKRA